MTDAPDDFPPIPDSLADCQRQFEEVDAALDAWERWASGQFMVLPESPQGYHLAFLRRRRADLLERIAALTRPPADL